MHGPATIILLETKTKPFTKFWHNQLNFYGRFGHDLHDYLPIFDNSEQLVPTF